MSIKHLGQNFLINKEVLQVIAHELSIKEGDYIVEIGPGHGELTSLLTQQKQVALTAIEKDKTLIPGLRNKFSNVEIIEGDALRILPKLCESQKLKTSSYKLVGNIPYYITGHLFHLLSELKNKPVRMVFTVQKEVANRITSQPPRQNLLSASIGIWSKPKLVAYIPHTDFRPTPEVDSAILSLDVLETNDLDLKSYFSLLHVVFRQPRKTIWNNIKDTRFSSLKERFSKLGITNRTRPQELSIETLIKLAEENSVARQNAEWRTPDPQNLPSANASE